MQHSVEDLQQEVVVKPHAEGCCWTERCAICGLDLSARIELDQLAHVDQCVRTAERKFYAWQKKASRDS